MKKIAMITGATSGIGKATAVKLAANNYNIIITGRREDLLENLKSELGVKYHADVLTLCFDVRDRGGVEEAIAKIPVAWRKINVLVNNAGLASGLSPVQEGNVDDWDVMIDTNIKGLLYMTRGIVPLMIQNGGGGHVINISSIAGKEVYEQGNAYCATKHAVEALSRGMRIDLLKHQIKVTNIAPGMVDTEFSIVRFHGDKERAAQVYEGLTPLFADDIAEAILFAITRPPHVNINDMLIMPTAQANASTVNRKMN